MSDRLFKLASIDRLNATDTSSDFWLNSAKELRAGSQWRLHSILMPASAYNVNANNNVIPLHDTSDVTATITPGYYTLTTMSAAVASALNAVGSQTYTVSISTTTQAMTISAASSFTLKFSQSTGTNAAALLGFAAATDTASATSQTGGNVVNVQPTLAYYISIDTDHSIQSFTPAGCSATFMVPLTVNTGNWIWYAPGRSAQQVWHVSQTKKRMHVRVLDDRGRTVNLNGVEWYALLENCHDGKADAWW